MDHLLKFTIRHLTYPAWLIRDGNAQTLKYIRQYGNNDWCSSENRIRTRQLAGLRRILSHAYENTGYYKSLFDQAGFNPYAFSDFGHIASLPILTKETIRGNINAMIAGNIATDDLLQDSTGGSTGVPLVFYRDKNCIRQRKAQELYFDRWIGYNIGDRVGLFVAARHCPTGLGGIKRRLRNATSERLLAFDPSRTDEAYMADFYHRLKRFKPDIIKSFPNSLTVFADFLKKNGWLDIRPRAVSCTGETLYDRQRALFEEVFQCPVFEKYASFENGVLACECSEHRGQHIFTDAAFVEFLNDGVPAKPGEMGDIIVTDLFNYGMPLIRYQIGDKAIATDRRCPCGSKLPLVEKILGRDRDIIIASGGRLKPGYLFVEVFNKNHVPGKFQVVQETRNKVTVKIVRAESYSPDHDRLIRENFSRLLGDEVMVEIVYVEDIPREASGKYAYVKSKVGN